MNVNLVLQRLKDHRVNIYRDTVGADGYRTIQMGCNAPSPPFALGRVLYYTLVLYPGVTDVTLEEREAIRRRLWHATTDIFGDDAVEVAELTASGASDEEPDLHEPPAPYEPEDDSN